MYILPFLCILLSILFPAIAAEQQAEVNTDIDVTFTSIQLTKNGLQVSVTYISHLTEPIKFTLTYPQDKAGFASDNLGNEYALVNATGMNRKEEHPNYDITIPDAAKLHSTFLLAPPEKKVSASFLFKRTTDASKEKPAAFNISISHYARPANNFDPNKQASRAFGFTATVTNAKPL